jgi:LysR family glycine cleavage system transcriptional activator
MLQVHAMGHTVRRPGPLLKRKNRMTRMQVRNAKTAERLPSLDLLKGFEAAARLLSFTRAGAELHLTQSAVSRQIRELEEQLGAALFERRHRALALTEAGRQLYSAAAQVLATMREATGRLRAAREQRVLSVTTSGTFASMWLVPRLAGFTRDNPGVDVRVSASTRMEDLERAGFDLALRYCAPEGAGAGALRLFGERMFPVCSPKLLQDKRGDARRTLARPADLGKHVLLHIDDPEGAWPWMAWRTWLEVAGVADLRPAGNLRFTNYSEVVQAAIAAQGVALGRSPLVREAMRAGKLVAPFGLAGDSSRVYYLVMARNSAERPEVRRFAEWVKREAKR